MTGQPLTLVGQSADGTWLQVADGMWIAAFLVQGAPVGVVEAPALAPVVVEATAIPAPVWAPPPAERSGGGCCKICSTGKACGDSCISRSYTCHKGPGCACDG